MMRVIVVLTNTEFNIVNVTPIQAHLNFAHKRMSMVKVVSDDTTFTISIYGDIGLFHLKTTSPLWKTGNS